MQTLEVLRTLEWLRTTGEAFFKTVQEVVSSPPAPEIPMEIRLQLVYRHAQLREGLIQNPRAVQVLTSFGLKEAMLEAAVILDTCKEDSRDRSDMYRRLYHTFLTPWRDMLSCIEPFKKLTVPPELATESSPGDIITVKPSGARIT